MSILLIPLTYMLVMGIICMGPFGWIMLAIGLELFGAAKPRRKRVMGYTEWRELTPEQKAGPAPRPAISNFGLVCIVIIIAILGAAALAPTAGQPRQAVTFPLSR
jgi:hypothetical protein